MRAGLLGSSSAVAILVTLAAVPGTAGAAAGRQPSLWRHGTPFRELVVSSPTRGGGYPGAKPAPGGCRRAATTATSPRVRWRSGPGPNSWSGRRRRSSAAGAPTSRATRCRSPSMPTAAADPLHRGLRLRHDRHPGDAAVLDQRHRPEPRLGPAGPGPPAGARLQRLLGQRRAAQRQRLLGVLRRRWTHLERGNGGRPVEAGPDPSVDATTYLDKPWIAANQNPRDPRRGHVYGAWVLFTDSGAEIHTAVSRDHGATWSRPRTVATPVPLGPKNPWPMIAVGPRRRGLPVLCQLRDHLDGRHERARDLWSARSTDDGRTWSRHPQGRAHGRRRQLDPARHHPAPLDRAVPRREPRPARTPVRRLEPDPARPGRRHALLLPVTGATRESRPRRVNDDRGRQHQFSATVAAGPHGAVVVGFYDMRARCPSDASDPPRSSRRCRHLHRSDAPAVP